MTPHDLYGRTFACECGKTHAIEPREALCAADALDRLPDVCARAAGERSAVVLTDVRTRAAAGAAAAAALRAAGWTVREIVVPDPAPDRSPVCDDATHDRLAGETAGAGLVVSVGSGVLSDLGKWLAYDAGVPCVSFATAASMNGYASANVAPTLAGVKSLLRARPPRVVLASPDILCAAPRELTTAGLGDVLAKCTSSADWRMNHILFGDYYCARSVGLIAEIEPLYLEHPQDVAAGDARAVGALFDALLLTGVAMTMAESSAPASGGEHLISHTLDMLAVAAGGEHDLHGRQVGVGTILMCELYRRVLAVESPKFRTPPEQI
ncbi:MAG TPA: iron-containing alcohol dehydrogenase, partial [Phycisphaerae bacterium]|nr:iron-containing alcohol dehydrogenase [Phycisphaerae bacterium]